MGCPCGAWNTCTTTCSPRCRGTRERSRTATRIEPRSCCSWRQWPEGKGQEQLFPWVSSNNICQKLQVYVESLVQFIDDDYKFYCESKEKRARREEVVEKLGSMSEKKKKKYLSVAKITYESLTQRFLEQKHKSLKRELPKHELNSLFPLYPMDDVGLMHLPQEKRMQLVASRNKKQLHLRQDYVNMVKEKAKHKNKVLKSMNKFLCQSSADAIILKVYDIQTQESECVQSDMVVGSENLRESGCVKPQVDDEESLEKDGLKGLDWDDSSDEEDDDNSDLDWLEANSYNDEEEMLREEAQERKAAEEREATVEPLSLSKIFRELHAQYYRQGMQTKQNTVQESYPTCLPFEDRPWETPVHHAILDRFVRHLSSVKSRGYRRLRIDFQREIRRLWHYKPTGFIKTIQCYEKLRKLYIKKQRKAERTTKTRTKETDIGVAKKRKIQDDDEMTQRSKKTKLEAMQCVEKPEEKECSTNKTTENGGKKWMKRKFEEDEETEERPKLKYQK
ncbi:hypothetical protein GWK47_022408 [Chionoecetes opilio]|uniref:Uncharacterized protein n=1 Tax=Chionoecetes opilio TaxID=41210 RepID=A0A8J5CDS0_CHIOP|nr:hypothetical protein GWK47_022408 [Chionoecetes opilio]